MDKPNPSSQLPLHLPVEAARARDDLVVTDANKQAVAFMDSWPQWPGPIAILAGPTGAGKSHLAEIWATRAEATFLSPSKEGTDIHSGGNVVVEDITQGGFSENWLFHLINSVRASQNSLLLTSRRWPGDWGITLPDLQSRMKVAHLMELNEPDDALLAGVLIKLFSDRQLTVDTSVIDYLVLRMERSLASAQILVAIVDRLSLVEKRRVTKPLASQALRELGLQD